MKFLQLIGGESEEWLIPLEEVMTIGFIKTTGELRIFTEKFIFIGNCDELKTQDFVDFYKDPEKETLRLLITHVKSWMP
jgi:hypothetical protein